MTKKSKPALPGKKRQSYAEVEYADAKLDANDKTDFDAWCSEETVTFDTVLEALVGESYRVTFKYDYNNQCVTCTLTQQDDKHHNANLVIINRSDNPSEALLIGGYKVYSMFEGERLPTDSVDNSWG